MVGDHVYVSADGSSSAAALVELATTQECAVSGVQPTRENELAYFGAVSGQRMRGTHNVYAIDRVVEKPTPTEAEQSLLVPGLRSGHYLCFFGIHVLTPTLFSILEPRLAAGGKVDLSSALNALAAREKYLAVEATGKRYPIDVKYGLLNAQLALALNGQDQSEVLALLCEVLAQRNTGRES
jgi:UTP--glucose-1-phosphate uridylyltransferase